MAIKIIVLVVLTAVFAFEGYKHHLARLQRSLPLPENVRDVYDADRYRKWSDYAIETNRVSLQEKGALFALVFVLLLFNIHAWFAGLMPKGDWANSILLVLFDLLITLPIHIYFAWVQQMRVEEKYGFNRTSRETFVSDQIKQAVISLVFMLAILCLYKLFYQALGLWGFALLFVALALIITLITTFSLSISKLFNKYEPLPEGELRSRLEALFEKHGYALRRIHVMDASRRTSKVNAFCAGLGKNKEIALFDNLVANYSAEEITAVFAHELGHYHYRDTAALAVANTLTFLPMVALLLVLTAVPAFCQAFGFQSMHHGMVFVLVGYLMEAVSLPMNLPLMKYMHACELRADAFAARNGYGEALISALKRLSGDNLSNLNPHPLIVKMEYSHPTLSQRIEALSGQGTGSP